MRRIALLALPVLLVVPSPARAVTAAAAARGPISNPGTATFAGGVAALNAVRGSTGLSASLSGLLRPTFSPLLTPLIDLTLPTLSSVYAAAERFKARVMANVARVLSTDQWAADYQPSAEVLEAARALNAHRRTAQTAPGSAGRGQGFDTFEQAQAAQAAAAGMEGRATGARQQATVIDLRFRGLGQGGSTEDLLDVSEASFDGSST